MNIKTSLELSRNLGFEEPIETLITTIAKNERIILIIDSLDVLSHNQDSINMFLNLIDRVFALKNVSILCSSRKFDLEYSLYLRDVKWDDKIFLQDLSEDEIGNIVSRLQLPQEEEILKNLKEICNTPIKLRILSKVSSDIREGIECIWDLYQLYWKRYVIISPSADSEMRKKLCLSIAEKMFNESSFSVLNDQIEESKAKNDLLSAGVLITNREYISFFHQTFSEYLYSKIPYFQRDLIVILTENRYNLFIRPIFITILSILRFNQFLNYIEEMKAIFAEKNIPFHFKAMIVSSICQLNQPREAEIEFLKNIILEGLFDEKSLIRTLDTPKWLEIFKTPLFVPIFKRENYNSAQVELINYFQRIAHTATSPDLFLDFYEIIPKKTQFDLYLHRFLDILKKMDNLDTDKLRLLVSNLITRENSDIRWRILQIVKKSVNLNPLFALNTVEQSFLLIYDAMRKFGVLSVKLRDLRQENLAEYYPLKESIEILNSCFDFLPLKGTILTLELLERFYELINEKFKDFDRKKLFDDNLLTVYNLDDGKPIKKTRSDEINPVESFIFLLKEKISNLAREDCKNFEEILKKIDGSCFLIIRRIILEVLWKNYEKYPKKALDYFKDHIHYASISRNLDYEMSKILKTNFIMISVEDKIDIRKRVENVFTESQGEKPYYLTIELLNRLEKEDEIEDIEITPPFSISGGILLGSRIPFEELKSMSLEKLLEELKIEKTNGYNYDPFAFYNLFDKVVSEDPVKYIDFIYDFNHNLPSYSISAGLRGLKSCKSVELAPKLLKIIKKFSISKEREIRYAVLNLITASVDLIQAYSVSEIDRIIIPIFEDFLKTESDPTYDYSYFVEQKGFNLNEALDKGINTVKGALVEAIVKVYPYEESKSQLINLLIKLSKNKCSSTRATVLIYLPQIIYHSDDPSDFVMQILRGHHDPKVLVLIPTVLWYYSRFDLKNSVDILFKIKNGFILDKIIESNNISFNFFRQIGWYGVFSEEITQVEMDKICSREIIKKMKFEVQKKAYRILVLLDLWERLDDNFIEKECRIKRNPFHQTLLENLIEAIEIRFLSKKTIDYIIMLIDQNPTLIGSAFYVFARADEESLDQLFPLIQRGLDELSDMNFYFFIKYLKLCSYSYSEKVVEIIEMMITRNPNLIVYQKDRICELLGVILTIENLDIKTIKIALEILDDLYQDGIIGAKKVFEAIN